MGQDTRQISSQDFQEFVDKLDKLLLDNKSMNRLSVRVDNLEDKQIALDKGHAHLKTTQEGQQRKLNSLTSRMDSQEDQMSQLSNSIEMSNDLHEKHREALDSLTSMISEMKDLLQVWTGAKTTFRFVAWVGSILKWAAITIGAGTALYFLAVKGVPIKFGG